MSPVFKRRYALLGMGVWFLAKRQLRRKLHAMRRRPFSRLSAR